MTSPTPTRADYDAAFERERAMAYPAIDAFEQRMGFSVDRARLEAAARVLACPVKRNPPNWQHGRVIYAAARRYLKERHESAYFLDIGTAKGFSVAAMTWAASDAAPSIANDQTIFISVDVVDPCARVRRNTVAELDGLKTAAEVALPFLDRSVVFHGMPVWLPARVNFAFVDGKHTFEAVTADAAGIKARQRPGDVIIFDDLQIPGVDDAVGNLTGYTIERLACKPERQYAIATRC